MRSAVALIVSGLLAIPAIAADQVFTKTLDNGLRIVVLEERRAPIAMQMLCYGVGSMDETPGKTGLSHALEHLMFKGTPSLPGKAFSTKVHELGGIENAFTSYDFTAYHQIFAKEHLETMMAMEADRMRNLVLTDNDFDQEIKVVRDERLRGEDDPYDMLGEQMRATAYQTHPYRNPVIGWMPDLLRMTRADAERWYRQWYAPNHAVLIVAGDVDAETVFALAQKHYGPYSPNDAFSQLVNRDNPTFRGMRRIEVKHPQAELPAINIAFPAPSLANLEKSDDVYALAVLSAVLDADTSARLDRRLVRDKKIARMAWAGYSYIRRGPSLFTLGGAPSEGHSVDELEAALRAEVKKIAASGVEPAELERIKAGIIAEQHYLRDSLVSRVNLMAALVMVGLPPDGLDAILEKLRQVTSDQVQAVAQKYFDADLSTVVVLRSDTSVAPIPADRKKIRR